MSALNRFGTLSLILTSVAALLLPPRNVVGASPPPCSVTGGERLVGSSLASAGFFANLRNAKHSINYVTDKLLMDARIVAQAVSHEGRGCKDSCNNPVAAIVFTSTPYRVLDSYYESVDCQRFYDQTLHHPIVYEKRSFDSEDDAKEWYSDLTRGRGEDGEDLYTRCPGSCSPAYSSVAYKHGDRFMVTATIICGHARDKDDDQYSLRASVRWICP
jgi:hypothetical protein